MIIAALAVGYLLVEFQGEPVSLFFVALIGLNFLGGAALAANQPRLGAALLIVGNIPLVPLGLLGIWGGVRILKQGKDAPLDGAAGVVREEFYSVLGKRFVLMGVVAITVGSVLFFVVFPGLGIFVAIGLVWVIMGVKQMKEPFVSLYEQHLKVTESPLTGAAKTLGWGDFTDVTFNQESNQIVIRYDSGSGEKTVSIDEGVVGPDNLQRIFARITAWKEKGEAHGLGGPAVG